VLGLHFGRSLYNSTDCLCGRCDFAVVRFGLRHGRRYEISRHTSHSDGRTRPEVYLLALRHASSLTTRCDNFLHDVVKTRLRESHPLPINRMQGPIIHAHARRWLTTTTTSSPRGRFPVRSVACACAVLQLLVDPGHATMRCGRQQTGARRDETTGWILHTGTDRLDAAQYER